MCLYLKEEWFGIDSKVAKEDIVCYKVMLPHSYFVEQIDYNRQLYSDTRSPVARLILESNHLKLKESMEAGGEDYVYSLYRNMAYKVGDTYQAILVHTHVRSRNVISNDIIEDGLHSFTDFDTVKSFVKDRKKSYNAIVLECVIPKGSRYYHGKFAGRLSYASDTLKAVKIVEI